MVNINTLGGDKKMTCVHSINLMGAVLVGIVLGITLGNIICAI